ncbi:MAG: hypothetical protein GVY19_09795 [Bacteroidetes bacterium]|nr:hypothetical protein [Bacteroidota bacterium]
MKVNHLLIGAGRSGSTTFCKYLEEHPQVCFSRYKEVHFFSQADLFNRGNSYYHSFFKHCSDQPIIASADTYLMIDYEAISRIHSYNKDMKILVILRDPVERAFSSYVYAKNYGYQKKDISFLLSLEYEKELLKKDAGIIALNNLGHFYSGLYHKHLQQWLEVFPPENFFITTTKALQQSPQEVLNQYCAFANINPFEISNEKHLNPSAKARFIWFEQFLLNRDMGLRKFIRHYTPQKIKNLILNSSLVEKLHAVNRKKTGKEKLTDEERDKVNDYFKEDSKHLKALFGIDFSS